MFSGVVIAPHRKRNMLHLPIKEKEMIIERMLPRKLRGFTLTEAAIVLGIVGLILGAIWVAAAAVYNNLRVSTTSNQLLQIAQSVRSIHAASTVVDPNITALMVAQAGGMPRDMVADTDGDGAVDTVSDVWGGTVTVDAAAIDGVANAGFTVTFANVPQGACSDLLVRNTGQGGRDSGLRQAGIAGALADIPNTGISISTATSACVSATNNTIGFTFALRS
jgi:type II secretory pathway pseudopilin PulG